MSTFKGNGFSEGDFIESCQNTLASLSFPNDEAGRNDGIKSLLLSTGTERAQFLNWILQHIKCPGNGESDNELKDACIYWGFVAESEVDNFILGTAEESNQLVVWKRIFKFLDIVSKFGDPCNIEPLFAKEVEKLASKPSLNARLKAQVHKNKQMHKEIDNVVQDIKILINTLKNSENIKSETWVKSQEGPLSELKGLKEVLSNVFLNVLKPRLIAKEEDYASIPGIVDVSVLDEINSTLDLLKKFMQTKSAVVQELEKFIQMHGDSSAEAVSNSLDFSPVASILNAVNENP